MKVLINGADPDQAKIHVLMLHGRGAGAEDMLGLSVEFEDIEGVCFLAPQAMNRSWYPERFLVPRSRNEPYLSLSLASIKGLIEQFSPQRLVLAGFSQGACLVSDLLCREPARYGGAWIFSGGYIGDDGETPEGDGDLAGTPVVLGGSDRDPHVPLSRMRATVSRLEALGGQVETVFYPGSLHTVTSEEVKAARRQLLKLSDLS